jgi:hypothetical protein
VACPRVCHDQHVVLLRDYFREVGQHSHLLAHDTVNYPALTLYYGPVVRVYVRIPVRRRGSP